MDTSRLGVGDDGTSTALRWTVAVPGTASMGHKASARQPSPSEPASEAPHLASLLVRRRGAGGCVRATLKKHRPQQRPD